MQQTENLICYIFTGAIYFFIILQYFRLLLVYRDKISRIKIAVSVIAYFVCFICFSMSAIMENHQDLFSYIIWATLYYQTLLFLADAVSFDRMHKKILVVLLVDLIIRAGKAISYLMILQICRIVGFPGNSIRLLCVAIGTLIFAELLYFLHIQPRYNPIYENKIKKGNWVILIYGGYLLVLLCFKSILMHTSKEVEMMFFATLFIILTCGYLFYRQHQYKKYMYEENYYLSIQKNIQEEHYKTLENQIDIIRQFRHDVANHLQSIRTIRKLKNVPDNVGELYQKELRKTWEKLHQDTYCEDMVLNAAVSNKVKECQREQIPVDMNLMGIKYGDISQAVMLGIFYGVVELGMKINQNIGPQQQRFLNLSAEEENEKLILRMEIPWMAQEEIKEYVLPLENRVIPMGGILKIQEDIPENKDIPESKDVQESKGISESKKSTKSKDFKKTVMYLELKIRG